MNIRPLSYALSLVLCLTAAVSAQIPLAELLDNTRNTITMEQVAGEFYDSGYLTELVQGRGSCDGNGDEYFRCDDMSYYAVAYKISLASGNNIVINSGVYNYDSYLYVYRKNGEIYELVASNDDESNYSYNSRIDLIGVQAGNYYIVVTTLESEMDDYYNLGVRLPLPLPISFTELLTSKAKPITKAGLPFVDTENMVNLVAGEGDCYDYEYFRCSGDNYFAAAYKITLAKDDKIVINSSKKSGDPYLMIYKKDGNAYTLIATQDYYDYDPRFYFHAEVAGEYYIVLTDYDPEKGGSYSLGVRIYAPMNIAELLDSTTYAISLAHSYFDASGEIGMFGWVAGDGTFGSTGENYYAVAYKATLPKGTYIEINVSKPDGDSYLYLYRKNGNSYTLIDEDDDGCAESSCLNYTANEAGDYYIVITDFYPNEQGYYYLDIQMDIPTINIATLLNGTTQTITYSKNLAFVKGGKLVDLVASDYGIFGYGGNYYATAYKITLAVGNHIEISSSKERDSYLYVYRKDGNEYDLVDENDDFGGSLNSRLSIIASVAGDYYIVVTDNNPGVGGSYELKVWNTAEEPAPVIAKSVPSASFQAWTQNGTLHLNGLTVGKAWKVYSATGSIVSQGVANGPSASVHLNAKGVYFVRSEKQTVRVVNK